MAKKTPKKATKKKSAKIAKKAAGAGRRVWPPELRSSDKKTQELFAFAGERRKNVLPTHHARDAIAAIEDAIRNKYGDRAREIAFHLSDWSADAAFIVAVHLYPDRFTREEIRKGVEDLIIHAPSHLAAAGALAGYPVRDLWELGFKVPPDERDED